MISDCSDWRRLGQARMRPFIKASFPKNDLGRWLARFGEAVSPPDRQLRASFQVYQKASLPSNWM